MEEIYVFNNEPSASFFNDIALLDRMSLDLQYSTGALKKNNPNHAQKLIKAVSLKAKLTVPKHVVVPTIIHAYFLLLRSAVASLSSTEFRTTATQRLIKPRGRYRRLEKLLD